MKRIAPWLMSLMGAVGSGIHMPPVGEPRPQTPLGVSTGRRGGSGAWRRGGRLRVLALDAWYEQLLARKQRRPISGTRPRFRHS